VRLGHRDLPFGTVDHVPGRVEIVVASDQQLSLCDLPADPGSVVDYAVLGEDLRQLVGGEAVDEVAVGVQQLDDRGSVLDGAHPLLHGANNRPPTGNVSLLPW